MPFVDAGRVGEGSTPSLSGMRYGAGIGGRYYTNFGPMRLDIATPHGQPVYSPSDGTVVFAGIEAGYGNVLVLDHGYGVKTRYGHLSEIFVHLGDRIRRMQLSLEKAAG